MASAARLVLGALLQPALFALMLFGPIDTLAWWRAWVLIAVISVASAASLFSLRRDPDLIAERFKPPLQRGQPWADKVVVLLLGAALFGTVTFVPRDVFVLRLLPCPPVWLSALGLLLFAAGWWIVMQAMRSNTFAAPVVRHQAERHQRVVDSGPYAVVRHPMYAGVALMLIGLPLWLESLAGVVVAGIPILVLAVRIAIEERFLRRELAGYDEYATRVRHRLIPGLW